MDLSVNDVCTSPQTFVTLYDQPPLQTGDLLYKNTGGTSVWLFSELQAYFVGTPTFIYVERNGAVATIKEQSITGYAVVDSTTTCPSPTPSPSITNSPSVTPSISITPTRTPSISISPTTSISITPTRTPSPSTSDALNSLSLDMANNSYDACHNPESFIVVYDQPPLQTGDYLYKSSAGTSKYTYAELQVNLAGSPYPLYLSNGSSVYEVNQDGSGDAIIASIAACVSATPPASVTPSNTPSISITKTPSATPPPSVTPTRTPSISVSKTPSISITPTRTPSPSTSDGLNSLFLDMANNSYDACHNPESFVVVYDQPPLQNGDYLYKSSAASAKYTYAELQSQLAGSPYPLYLSDGSTYYEVNQDGSGDAVIASNSSCVPVTPPASVTRTPSTTPPVSPSNTPPASATPSVTPSKSFVTPSTSSTPPASVTPTKSVSTTPPNSPVYCPSQTLGYATSTGTYADACQDFDAGGATKYLDASFTLATYIYRYSDCTGTAPTGYYSDGTDWRYWDNGTASFTTGGDCGTY